MDEKLLALEALYSYSEALGADFRNGIYQAIRIANKLTAPSLLTVPLPPPQPGEMASRDRHNAPLVALGAGAP